MQYYTLLEEHPAIRWRVKTGTHLEFLLIIGSKSIFISAVAGIHALQDPNWPQALAGMEEKREKCKKNCTLHFVTYGDMPKGVGLVPKNIKRNIERNAVAAECV